MVRNPGQFHQLPPDQQKKLADHYVKAMAIIHKEGIPYVDLGMRKQINTPFSTTILWPHTGKWVMTMANGHKSSGRTVRELIKVLKHHGR